MIKENREKLFRYIWGILKNKKCVLYQVNGVEDHLHIFTHIHSSISVADLVRDIKKATNGYIKSKNLFPGFESWQVGYGELTYSIREKDMIINYVKKQESHHKTKSYIDELKQILKENGIEYDEKYLS